ncbi:DUF6705 family protein [Chryseobacterium phocaeense]|uniref:DUF6705 family protein n=1 Tax=Chryseobacterium phocaeense TaxID=1816690 RepID=UPI0009BB1082|nr:DUF6705 family protein [Chryseobacterium phocaeense]
MKNIFFIILSVFSILLNAQTVSLETMSQYSPGNYPAADYVKDSNGLLNKYVGTWKGTLDGNTYEFNFIKKENMASEFSSIKWDRLIGRVKITSSNGTVIFDNFNKSDDDANWGHNFQRNLKLYLITFSGGKSGCVDYGFIYAGIKPETPNQMTVNFHPDNDIVTQNCTNFKTTMPTNQVIHLTKQ